MISQRRRETARSKDARTWTRASTDTDFWSSAGDGDIFPHHFQWTFLWTHLSSVELTAYSVCLSQLCPYSLPPHTHTHTHTHIPDCGDFFLTVSVSCGGVGGGVGPGSNQEIKKKKREVIFHRNAHSKMRSCRGERCPEYWGHLGGGGSNDTSPKVALTVAGLLLLHVSSATN